MSTTHTPPKLPNMASDLHRMGDGYSCAFRFKDGAIQCTWHPAMPTARKLRRIVESGKYYAARHVFLAEIASRIGGAVVCLDL
jgi:hypothetical protein